MGILDGKKAVIIGASGGIGLACAREFLAEGALAAGSYRTENEDVLTLAEDSCFNTFQLDLNDKDSISGTIRNVIKQLGGIDILVNAAGIAQPEMLFSAAADRWENVIESNLISVFYTVQSVIVPMVVGKGGSVINISSVFGLRGGEGQSSYCASKAGIIGLTKAAAIELAGVNIRVNAVAPGYIETSMTEGFSDAQRKKCIARIPMKRFGQAREAAQLCVFLASDRSSYITGQTFVVDGGLSI